MTTEYQAFSAPGTKTSLHLISRVFWQFEEYPDRVISIEARKDFSLHTAAVSMD